MSEKAISTVREAKDYLAGRIVAQAKREQVPLSEIERKMLYFSETDWTLPGMHKINAEFERDYDNNEYERKIAGLIRNIEAGDAGDEQEQETWQRAVDKLAEGDNYLSILLDPSFTPAGEAVHPPHDRLRLWLTALGVVVAALGLSSLFDRLQGSKLGEWLSHRNNLRICEFGLIAFSAVIYWRFGARISAVVDRLFNQKKTSSRTQ